MLQAVEGRLSATGVVFPRCAGHTGAPRTQAHSNLPKDALWTPSKSSWVSRLCLLLLQGSVACSESGCGKGLPSWVCPSKLFLSYSFSPRIGCQSLVSSWASKEDPRGHECPLRSRHWVAIPVSFKRNSSPWPRGRAAPRSGPRLSPEDGHTLPLLCPRP